MLHLRNIFHLYLTLLANLILGHENDTTPSVFKNQTADDDSVVDNLHQPRIAGGHNYVVREGRIPYHIQIRYLDEYHCGGALVKTQHGNQIVITSGQCITQKSGTKFLDRIFISLVAGRIKIDGFHYYEQFRSVKKMIRHPNWKQTYSLYYHDIAILHPSKEFEINQLVQPINLPLQSKTKPQGKVVITGWGYTGPTNAEQKYSDILQVSTIDPVSNEDCKHAYYGVITAEIQPNHLCLGKIGNPTYQGGCLGDAGSPAVATYNYQVYLAGVYNWGQPKCGNRWQPSIYQDVSYYLQFIAEYGKPDGKGFTAGRSAIQENDAELSEFVNETRKDLP